LCLEEFTAKHDEDEAKDVLLWLSPHPINVS
jgi:hypothetical protein